MQRRYVSLGIPNDTTYLEERMCFITSTKNKKVKLGRQVFKKRQKRVTVRHTPNGKNDDSNISQKDEGS